MFYIHNAVVISKKFHYFSMMSFRVGAFTSFILKLKHVLNSLLSVLYGELVDLSTSKQAAIMLKLFLKSFEVYLDIIDAWLTHGHLQDCREEFVITR